MGFLLGIWLAEYDLGASLVDMPKLFVQRHNIGQLCYKIPAYHKTEFATIDHSVSVNQEEWSSIFVDCILQT